MKKKLKVAWICPLDFSRFKDRLDFHENPSEVLAPWMTLLTEIFEAHTDETELHVISAPSRLGYDTTIIENGIHYHFISQKLPFINRKTPFILKKTIHYTHVRRKVKKLVNTIKPDFIEFHGAEHDLAWSFFDLDHPKMLTPQYFVNNYYRFRQTKYLRYWMKVEKNIYKSCRHFSFRNEHMKNEIMALNPRAILHKYQYPIKKPVFHARDYPIKEHDIVFTARLITSKGIEDLLKAVQVVKEEIPGVKVKVIGQSDPKYLEVLKNLSVSLGIGETVEFAGFLSTQEEMFEEIAKAKLSVLPTHFDLIPGSVIEAMQIGTPVLAYYTGGLPELNREKETIRLTEVANIGLLAKEIIALLKNEEDRLKLAESAADCMVKMFDNDKIYSDMIRAYYDVMADYNPNRKYL